MSDYYVDSKGIHELRHSYKGTEWKDHKYIRKENGVYYYKEDDKDFDESNYKDENLLGDTDFYGFQREDGTYVILNEDLKWQLAKGQKATPELIKRLESFSGDMDSLRNKGKEISQKNYETLASYAINNDVDSIAREVLKGSFGNGAKRKELLGSNYASVQKRVNEMMKKK